MIIKLFDNTITISDRGWGDDIKVSNYDCKVSQINGAMHVVISDENNNKVLVATSTNVCVIDKRS